MPDLTICVPVAPYHTDLAKRAVESIHAQTVECASLVYQDDEGRGAGYARNRLLEAVRTPLVSFLDADDTLEPDFAEKCQMLLGMVEGRRYVYTNWYEGDTVKVAPSPCDLWTQKTYHLVTTVMRVVDVKRIGGYDEHMPGAEDTDFGIRLKLSGVCGVHLNAPLVHYRKGGQRSVELRSSGQEAAMLAYMSQRYGEYTMDCCGDYNIPNTPTGERQDGDVLAMALWLGNRQERGRATGRLYPRASKPKTVYVDPRDVAAAPHLWQKMNAVPVNTAPVLQPGYQNPNNTGDWKDAANLAFGGGVAPQPARAEGASFQSQDWQYHPNENMRQIRDTLKIAQRKTE